MGMDVDMTGLVAVLGGLGTVGGIGGIVALLKVRKDNGLTEANTEKVHGDLASTVNTSAMGWVKYLDEKIDKVSTDFDEHRRQTKAREEAQDVLHAAHRVWDVKVQTRVEELSGEPFPSPPPLSLPASFRAA